MKISMIRSQILVLPEADPLAETPENPNAARPIVIVRIATDDGIEGIAVTFYGGAITNALKRAIDDLGALTIGEDPHRVEAIAAKLGAAAGGSGPAGMFTLALSAIDIALWDIRGKALGQPLWKLLGGARQRVATYASGALAPQPDLGPGGDRGRQTQRQRFPRSQDAVGVAWRHDPRQRSRARGQDPRSARPRHQIDVRHQPALAAGAGDRYRQTGRGCRGRAVLARRRDGSRRLRRDRSGQRGADDANLRRRIGLGHRPVPPHDRSSARSIM